MNSVYAAPPGPLIPIGGGYSDIYAGYMQAAVAAARNGEVSIVVLPSAYSTNAETITQAERARNLKDAEERRLQLQEACRRAAPAAIKCTAIVAPVFTRDDAHDPAALAAFKRPVTAVFMLGGDQTVAMKALVNTPLEDLLAKIYAEGGVIGGTSAGGGMLSCAMLAGYAPNFAAANSLNQGAAEVWNQGDRRGLCFGAGDIIFDQHFFQRGRLGRLLNAIVQPSAPPLGAGIDAYTGVKADGGRLSGVFGLYVVAILDAKTYGAAQAVRFVPVDGVESRVLSVHNVLVHTLAPGDFRYDIAKRTHSLAAPRPLPARDFSALRLPSGAGSLFLAGDLSSAPEANPVLARFAQAAGKGKRVLVYADGYASPASARRAADKYAAALGKLGLQTAIRLAGDAAPEPAPSAYDAVLLVGKDQSKLDLKGLSWLRRTWLSGKPLLADNAFAAAAGAFYAPHEPTPKDGEAAEFATQRSMLIGETQVVPGLGLLDATFEPQLLADNRWGRLFSLAYRQPSRVAIGLNRETALEITREGARVLGTNVVLTLDLRSATLARGTNDAFVIANGLLDSFAPGEMVSPNSVPSTP